MRCAIYVRVSREEQIEGWSLDAQLEQCRALAALRKWQIAHIYEEPGPYGLKNTSEAKKLRLRADNHG